MRKKIHLLVFAILAICCFGLAFDIHILHGDGKELEGCNLKMKETVWRYDGEKKEREMEYQLYAKKGDVLYEKDGYMLSLEAVYENKIVVKQNHAYGGELLVLANEDGSFNALQKAKESYKMKKGKKMTLRSYSLKSGISISIMQ